AMIFIPHNLGIVARMCDQVAVMYAGRLVEAGPVRSIFNEPAHPYTRALIESIPKFGDATERLTAIEGQPPDPAALPPGCAFHPRCPYVIDRCRAEAPPESQLARQHHARCWVAAPATVGAAGGGRRSSRPAASQRISPWAAASWVSPGAWCARWTTSLSPSSPAGRWGWSERAAAAKPPPPSSCSASKSPRRGRSSLPIRTWPPSRGGDYAPTPRACRQGFRIPSPP